MGLPQMTKYVVSDKKTGEELVAGTAVECAEALKISYLIFLLYTKTTDCKSCPYVIERDEPAASHEWEKDFIKSWDDAFSWYRNQTVFTKYPCDDCVNKIMCEYADSYCESWEKWYKEAHEKAGNKIRRSQGK